MSRLVGVGAAHIDRIGHVDGAFCIGASNPGRMREWVGGCMINTLRVAAALDGGSVAIVSARGGDLAGQAIADMIAAHGIEDWSAVFLDRSTPSYTAVLDEDGEVRAALADMQVYEECLPRHLRRSSLVDRFAAADRVIVDANLPGPAIDRIVEASRGPVIGLAVSPAKAARLRGSLAGFDMVIMNRRELAALTDAVGDMAQGDMPGAMAQLKRSGLKRAIVTDGASPVHVMEHGRFWSVPVPVMEHPVRDVTGAGDALAGTVIALEPRVGLLQAVRSGISAAAITTQFEGPVAADIAKRIAGGTDQDTEEPIDLGRI